MELWIGMIIGTALTAGGFAAGYAAAKHGPNWEKASSGADDADEARKQSEIEQQYSTMLGYRGERVGGMNEDQD